MPRPFVWTHLFGHIYLYSLHVRHPPQQDDQATERTYYLRLRANTKNDSTIIIFTKITFTYEPLRPASQQDGRRIRTLAQRSV